MKRKALLSFLFVTACGTARPTVPHEPQPSVRAPSSSSHEAAKGRATDPLAVFERLVAMARRYHLFAPQTEKNLGKNWEADLPRLREEFAKAKDKDALTVALWHFGNSLHDVHCGFRAADRGTRLKLGFRLAVEKRSEGFEFYVERVTDPALRDRIAPGDIVETVDGVSGDRLVDENDFASNMNSKEAIALDVAQYLTARRSAMTLVRAGDASSWTFRSRRGGSKTVPLTWKKGSGNDESDFALDYASRDCVDGDPRQYGPGYSLFARGYRVCVYASSDPRYRDYPVVRHVSFRYDEVPHGPLADFDLLSRTLSSMRPKGVVLDVQDNRGGINPNLFIEWWSDKPYTDTETHVLLDSTLLRGDRGEPHIGNLNAAVQAWYEGELQAHPASENAEGRRLSSGRPFMCKDDTCSWDNHYVPKHRVTKAPVALLLGPGCMSSCDAFAWHFDREDIGPIVGRSSAAGFTTHRARFDVKASENEAPLGTIDFAVSYDTAPGTSESIEGVPVTLDVPVAQSFENHEHYDRLLVDAAIGALGKTKR
jgi:hypothetical protein